MEQNERGSCGPTISSLFSLRLLCSRLRHVLLHSEFRDSRDQAVRNRLIEWKSQIAFLSRVLGNRLLQRCVGLDGRVEADVILERGEVNQNPVLRERRNPVA